jgi:hypothetical protein
VFGKTVTSSALLSLALKLPAATRNSQSPLSWPDVPPLRFLFSSCPVPVIRKPLRAFVLAVFSSSSTGFGVGRWARARRRRQNENEQGHLLSLVDDLLANDLRPGELWDDRGDDTERLREALRERAIAPMISRRRRPGARRPPLPAVTIAGQPPAMTRRGLATGTAARLAALANAKTGSRERS